MGGAKNDLRAAKSFASTALLKSSLNEAALAAWSEETSDERHLKLEISESERQRLWHVFARLCGNQPGRRYFEADDLRTVLLWMTRRTLPQQKLDLIVWEVDENLDKRVDEREFELMYKRCVEDREGIQPKTLFYIVQFLMFCPEPETEAQRTALPTITPEDTYFLIYARLDRQLTDDSKRARLDEEVDLIFREEDSTQHADLSKAIDFDTYIRRMMHVDLQNRTASKEAQRRKLKELSQVGHTG